MSQVNRRSLQSGGTRRSAASPGFPRGLFECKSREETYELVSQALIAAIFEKPAVVFQMISTVAAAGDLGRSLVKWAASWYGV